MKSKSMSQLIENSRTGIPKVRDWKPKFIPIHACCRIGSILVLHPKSNMVFGSQSQKTTDETKTRVSKTQRTYIDLKDEVVQQSSAATGCRSQKPVEDKDSSKPLFDKVTFHGAGNSKNPGGSKQWTCNHCKGKFTRTYTRIHVHFFGATVGKKAKIKRCPMVLRDRGLYERLFSKGIEEAFSMLERKEVDLKIVRGLCANRIPFNVLRNPQFLEMISAIKNAPAGYKPPSCEKARSNLLDECYRDIEKDLTPIKDTWYTQGVSIFSDGWSNVKRSPLINVLAVKSRGAMFMSGAEISNFLIGAIQTIGPSNVLSVVTDNAANCKAVGKEIEKTPELAEVVQKVLCQPISRSSAERNWSAYSYIHSVKRNRLNTTRADKLVFIHSNIRLQSRFSQSYNSGLSKNWDVNPESAYIEGSSSRMDEMVWEDLDEENNENGKGKKKARLVT
ncbi:hypothetical protein QVD17_00259 [Tagetes erecta]|uniref:DUF659 domain-containing protein n=1 Tax=Tagetes erecta TaxID=13708 RepID=A0AAD8LB94_TARER|nr:hypothetical protein QVD17_00259 [Tagetes erecta]